MKMVKRQSWASFRKTGLLLLLNQFLHIFGWAIVFRVEKGKVIEVYPARVKFRGFDEKSTSEAYVSITKYMKSNVKALEKEIR